MEEKSKETQFAPQTIKVLIGNVAELSAGARKVIQTRNGPILVVNLDGEVVAVSNICPHSGGYLNYGPIMDDIIECPLHFWPFNLKTGCLVGMPSDYDEHLQTYKVHEIENKLYLVLPLNNPPALL